MGTLKKSLALGLALAALTPHSWAREKPITAVADLRYGVALYDYYNDDYFSALSEILIANERGGIHGHGDNPEIMEGGLALGYGMERYASDIFERLLSQNRSPEVQDAAWFYLAKIRYRNAEWERAHDAISHIRKEPTEKIREDVNALRLNLFIKQEKLEEAERLLHKEDFSKAWVPFIYFNLGSAYARRQDYERAIEFFSHFSTEIYKSEGHRALYDKALTAAGYCLIFQKKYPQAIEQFSRVRLTSKMSSRALLGYGWASAELENYQEALKPWLYLSKSSLIDENNQEAMIAVPYAYEKLGNEGLALQHYKNAEASFLQEIGKLDQVIANLKSDDLLAALKMEVGSEGMDWLSFAEENKLSPQLTYLIALFSKNSFHTSVKELKNLMTLKENLQRWQAKFDFYGAMIDERESNRLAKAEYLEVARLESKIEGMREQRSELAAEIERVAAEKDYMALAIGDEADLVERALRVNKNIERLRATDPFVEEYEESARRYNGLLLWQTSEKFADRMWLVVRELHQLDTQIKELDEVRQRVQKLMDAAPDLDPYKVKMDTANAEIATHLADIDIMISRNEQDLRGKVVGELEIQRGKLLNFLAQSRLAIARIYDKASQAEQERLAPKPPAPSAEDASAEVESAAGAGEGSLE